MPKRQKKYMSPSFVKELLPLQHQELRDIPEIQIREEAQGRRFRSAHKKENETMPNSGLDRHFV